MGQTVSTDAGRDDGPRPSLARELDLDLAGGTATKLHSQTWDRPCLPHAQRRPADRRLQVLLQHWGEQSLGAKIASDSRRWRAGVNRPAVRRGDSLSVAVEWLQVRV